MANERWDRNRLLYERDRLEEERARMRPRDHSDDRFDRPRFHDEYLYDDEPPPRREQDYHRRTTLEREPEVSPRRPAQLRRQSSLDTFDRRPLRRFVDRDEYPPPARREDIHRDEAYRDDAYRDDYRAPPYTPIPLPKSRALPPPRRHPGYDDGYGPDPDDEFLAYPERVRERELVRERARTHRSSSRSSSVSSRSSRSGGGTTIRSEYPKRGKTRIPVRLVSTRALHDLGYRFVQESILLQNNTIIVQQALGQEHIDELLRVSEQYNKADQEAAAAAAAARSSAGAVMEDRREEVRYPPPPPTIVSAPPPAASRAPTVAAPPAAPLPTIVVPPSVPPPPPLVVARPPHEAPPVEVIDSSRTVIRDVSPARTTTTSTTSSWDSHHPHHHHHHRHHDDMVVGPVIHRSRSRSRSGREIRAEIRALERELAHRPKGVELGERDIVRTERMPDGELIVYQERVERQSAGPKPPRIEKDKKGRMSISVPKYR
ncbi:hypothetical protein L249_2594 [Ophiocordyceps polyrhachis-furcata BCC 54312]|uniref:DUF8035 domain-containing protein n=1 Tax=Ophiocordyceps polyrhachis-furcata BCC 54312 TaxID=1330021 RepID=A0A367LSA3_9HYPO|nr:hypothetical protein L249_2594 [Ophiocordyceps polyrhachis-furcata BCC 54312]